MERTNTLESGINLTYKELRGQYLGMQQSVYGRGLLHHDPPLRAVLSRGVPGQTKDDEHHNSQQPD